MIKQIPSNDFTNGRIGYEYIVMHWSVTSTIEQVDAEVLNPNRQMSYHYCVNNAEIHQYVKEENTAWHCGVFDINQRSIGICIVAGPDNPYTQEDYETAAKLIKEVMARHPELTLDKIKGHRDFKATQCPGNLDFEKLKNLIRGGDVELYKAEGEQEVYARDPLEDVYYHKKNMRPEDWAQVKPVRPAGTELVVKGSEVRVEIKEVEKQVMVPVIQEVVKYIDRPIEIPVNITTEEEKAQFIAEYEKDHPPVIIKEAIPMTLGQLLLAVWDKIKGVKLN